jgi:LPS export ABC transporter protein LptC
MGRVKHILLITALFIIAVIAYLSFHEIKGKSRVLKKDVTIKTNACAVLDDVLYIKTMKDLTEFKIAAKNAEYFKADGRSTFKDINAEFYTENGIEYHLTGNLGTYDTKKEEFLVKGDVVLLSGAGYELKAGSLFYSYLNKTISTPDMVKIKKGGLTIEGIGMKLDLKKERINIMQKVRGHVAGS